MATLLGRFQQLAKPATEWTVADPVLLLGELGIADPGSTEPIIKCGDGVRPFSALPEISGSGGGGAAPEYVAGPVTTLPPGAPATVTINNAADPPTISFGIPQGITGDDGDPGPPNVLAIGTVTTGAPGSSAAATITGTSPAQTLNLTIPQGPQGIQGEPGPSNYANPSALVGLTAVNGVAAAAMRADAAPAIDQNINPRWTGVHNYGSAGSMQTTAPIGARGRVNAIEWGHTNAAGYASTLGYQQSNGWPFLAFHAEAGTTANTYRTRGIQGRVLTSDSTGNLVIARAPAANADDQALVADLTIDLAGHASFAGNVSIAGGTTHTGRITIASGTPGYYWNETDQVVDERVWSAIVSGKAFTLRAYNDAESTSSIFLTATRGTGTIISAVNLGNATDNPNYNFLGTGNVFVGGAIRAANGTVALPGISWSNDADTGLWHNASTDSFSVVVGGAERVKFWTGTFPVRLMAADLVGDCALGFYEPDGTTQKGYVGFAAAADDAMYVHSNENAALLLGTNNTPRINITGDGVQIIATPIYRGPDGSAAAPAYSFSNDPNTGLYSQSADVVGISCGGVVSLSVGSGVLTLTGASGANAVINSAAVAIRDINYATNGVNRWTLRVNANPESGSNAGSDFQIIRRDDAGTSLGAWLQVTRATGETSIGGRLNVTGDFYPSGQFRVADGTVSAPTYAFLNDADCGMYRKTANRIGLVSAGVEVACLTDGVQLSLLDGVQGTPALGFITDTDTGMYRAAENTIGWAAGGAVRMQMSAGSLQMMATMRFLATDGDTTIPGIAFSADPNTGFHRQFPDAIDVITGGLLAVRFSIDGSGGAGIYLPAGSNALPSISFTGDGNTGIYRYSADSIGFATNGVARVVIDNLGAYFADGVAATPGISFLADGDTGVFRNGADQIGLSTGGVLRLNISSTDVVMRVPVLASAGSATAPAYAFEGDTNTGFYFGAQGEWRFTSDGVLSWLVRASGAYAADGTAAAPSVSFLNDPDTGMYRSVADVLGFATAGASRLTIASTAVTSTVAVSAPSFQTTSTRAVKKETGRVSRAADILARLRPILYRLLAGDDREQLGLIAEEVHECCPLLSDGKTVAYDRLALLLLADWQEQRAAA